MLLKCGGPGSHRIKVSTLFGPGSIFDIIFRSLRRYQGIEPLVESIAGRFRHKQRYVQRGSNNIPVLGNIKSTRCPGEK